MSLSRTIESLEEYIDAQREIIQRARADIQSLIALKRDAANDPQAFVENLTEKLSSASLLQNDLGPSGPAYVDWDLLKGSDPSTLHHIPIPSLKFRRSSAADDLSGSTDMQNQAHEIICEFKPRIEEALASASRENESPVRELSTPLPEPRITATGPKGRRPKERPALFNVPWTLQEQHLLEKCLLEIPETEKHRWVKISEAMGGIRTARQVASRVQKYNEKLKKIGLH